MYFLSKMKRPFVTYVFFFAAKRKTFGDLNEIPKEKPNRLTSNRRKSIFIKDVCRNEYFFGIFPPIQFK